MPRKPKLTKRQHSRAAKLGWNRRKRRLQKAEREGSAIHEVIGPHGRLALTKDWDGFSDHERLAKAVREEFPEATKWMWAFRARFITEEPDESRWISIPFDRNFRQQVQNSKDQVTGAIEGILGQSLRVVVPIQLTVIVQ